MVRSAEELFAIEGMAAHKPRKQEDRRDRFFELQGEIFRFGITMIFTIIIRIKIINLLLFKKKLIITRKKTEKTMTMIIKIKLITRNIDKRKKREIYIYIIDIIF